MSYDGRPARQARRAAYLRWTNSLTHGRITLQRRGGAKLYARIDEGLLRFESTRIDGQMTHPTHVKLTVSLPDQEVITFDLTEEELRPCAFLPPTFIPGPKGWSIVVPV